MLKNILSSAAMRSKYQSSSQIFKNTSQKITFSQNSLLRNFSTETAVAEEERESLEYDVLIVGGGPAGNVILAYF